AHFFVQRGPVILATWHGVSRQARPGHATVPLSARGTRAARVASPLACGCADPLSAIASCLGLRPCKPQRARPAGARRAAALRAKSEIRRPWPAVIVATDLQKVFFKLIDSRLVLFLLTWLGGHNIDFFGLLRWVQLEAPFKDCLGTKHDGDFHIVKDNLSLL